MYCRLAMGIGRVRRSIVDVGEAKIRDLHRAFGSYDHILWSQIAMEHSLRIRVLESFTDGDGKIDRH